MDCRGEDVEAGTGGGKGGRASGTGEDHDAREDAEVGAGWEDSPFSGIGSALFAVTVAVGVGVASRN